MTTATVTAVNGVDVNALQETIAAVSEQPALGRFVFRASNTWIDGGRNRSTIGSFYGAGREDDTRPAPFVMDNDEPAVLLGTDRGANPVEHVLHALAGCLTTSLVYHAAARGVEIDSVSCELEGDLDLQGFLGVRDDVRRGYEAIRVTFRIESPAGREKVEELLAIAQRQSPVFDIVSHPVPVQVALG